MLARGLAYCVTQFDPIRCYCCHSIFIQGPVMVVIALYLGLHLPVQSVIITTTVVSPNPTHGEVNSVQHYVIKFVSDLRQVGGFLQLLHQ